MNNLHDAIEKLNGRERRKIGNNTYLEKRDNGVAVRLHATDVITFTADGVVLNSGGWRTHTTKDRINTFAPVRVSQENSVWYVSKGVRFADGMTVRADGSFVGAIKEDPKANAQDRKQKRAVRSYCNAFVAAMEVGKVKAPSNGDCWYCLMRDAKTGKPLGEIAKHSDHIQMHIKEHYYVPSLLINAFDTFGASIMMKQFAGACFNGALANFPYADLMARDTAKCLYRYMCRQLGFAS